MAKTAKKMGANTSQEKERRNDIAVCLTNLFILYQVQFMNITWVEMLNFNKCHCPLRYSRLDIFKWRKATLGVFYGWQALLSSYMPKIGKFSPFSVKFLFKTSEMFPTRKKTDSSFYFLFFPSDEGKKSMSGFVNQRIYWVLPKKKLTVPIQYSKFAISFNSF